jgi:hypothetical protein
MANSHPDQSRRVGDAPASDGSRKPWSTPRVFVSLDARSSEIKHAYSIPDSHSLTGSYS